MSNLPDRLNQLSPLQRAVLALKTARQQIDSLKQAQHEPIAIIGMACRLPIDSDTPEAFWELLRRGGDGVSQVPDDRWDADTYYDPNPDSPGKMYSREGGFLRQVDQFDPLFFGISPREAQAMDPQQRLLLEVSYEALERAGQAPERLVGSRTGVFIGINSNDYSNLPGHEIGPADLDAYSFTGNTFSVASGRISYALGLQGPSVALDTACSSSLVALHLACQSLRNRESDMALAGGITLILSPIGHIIMSRMRGMAADGRCKTFDASADGYGRGEGCGVVVLKRLSDALAANDTILALVRGSAINQDGPSSGLTVPNGPAQQAVIRQALQSAGIEPHQVSYVEAHGTGTPLGDPIELQALGAVLGQGRAADRPLLVGSAKTNIGHLEAAAGIAGVIKLVLALQHREIPPHLHLHEPNPYIPWADLPIKVTTELMPWTVAQGRRIAGISSFGMSGTNAHIILEEAPERPATHPQSERPRHLLALSAKSEAALRELAGRYATLLADQPDQSLADLCYTAASGRSHFAHRLALGAPDGQRMHEQLAAFAAGADGLPYGQAHARTRPRVAFLFTGQGSQYRGMGQQLYDSQPTFRAAFDRCAEILLAEVGWDVRQVVFAEQAADDDRPAPIDKTEFTQPALFALEYALAQLWRSWGVEPDAVLGHSVGEYVAACIAGVFSLEDGLKLIAARGRLMGQLPSGGTMAAVFAPRELVEPLLAAQAGRVSVAAVNGPTETVISGAQELVAALLTQFEAAGIKSRPLTVSHAFHSPLMEPMLDDFEQVAATVRYAAPQIDLFSNVSGRLAEAAEIATPRYWRQHVAAAVLFADSIAALHQQGYRVVVEVGPKATLLNMAQKCLPDADVLWQPSLQKGRDDWEQLLSSLGALYLYGTSIDWEGFDNDYPRRRVVLPTYPFQRMRYWVEIKRRPSAALAATKHPLLGGRLRTAVPLFETELSPAQPLLAEHQLKGLVLAPLALLAELALAAAAEAGQPAALQLSNLTMHEPLVLADQAAPAVQVVLNPQGDALDCQIFSQADLGDAWLHLASASIARTTGAPEPFDLAAIRSACPDELGLPDYAAQLAQDEVSYGPRYTPLSRIWRGQAVALAQLAPAEAALLELDDYRAYPALIEACCRLLGLTVAAPLPGWLPVAVEQLTLQRQLPGRGWCVARLEQADRQELRGQLTLLDDAGQLVAELRGVTLRPLARHVLRRNIHTRLADWLYDVRWQPQVRPDVALRPSQRSSWLIFSDGGPQAAALAEQLHARGELCVTVLRGSGYAQSAADHYRIDPRRADDYRRLLSEVGKAGPLCRGVVYLWGLDSAPNLSAALSEPCESLLLLARAIASTGWMKLPQLWAVTTGAQPIAPGEQPALGQVPLWGLGRGLTIEYPQIWGGLIDIAPTATDTAALLAELWEPSGEDQIVLRDNGRYLPRLVRRELPAGSALSCDPDGSYLVVGGLDQLGLQLAGWLAAHGARRLILASEHTPDAQAAAALAALADGGATVELLRFDPQQPAQLAQQLSPACTDQLRGVFVTASPWHIQPLQDMPDGTLAATFRREGLVAATLDQLTRALPLDYFVLFGSTAAVWGSGGLASYAVAHRFFDGLASTRRALGLPAHSIAWSQWAEVGMLSDEGYRQSERSGVHALPTADALDLLELLLGDLHSHPIVAAVDWPTFKPVSEVVRRRSLLEQIGSLPQLSSAPSAKSDIVQQLEEAAPSERRRLLTAYVLEIAGDVLGFGNTVIEPQQGFFDLGMDSIMAVSLNNRLSSGLGQTLSPTLTFDYPSSAAVVTHLLVDVLALPTSEAPTEAPAEIDTRAAAEAELSALSEDDLLALLAAELSPSGN